MQISKVAQDNNRYRRPFLAFQNARSAFGAFLDGLQFSADEIVLLPAFIGWSPREGSGVFDPVTERGLSYRFYRMNGRLTIDLEHLRQLFKTSKVKVLVIIHYFGYVDPGYREAVTLAKEHGAFILEDEAHAMFTDLFGGISGRLGDACIFSLHKMLPVATGGLLVLNRESIKEIITVASSEESTTSPWEFDLHAIANRRIENASHLSVLLAPLEKYLEPLRRKLLPGEVPQTYPILIRYGSRDLLYQMMNEAGYGVVTLYHTLIKPITLEEFPESHTLSGHILNLPVHQDIEKQQLDRMVEKLLFCIRELL